MADPEKVNEIYTEGYGVQYDEPRHLKIREKLLKEYPDLQKDIEYLNENGYLIIKNVISNEDILEIKKEANKLFTKSKYKGRNKFEGLNTKRIYSFISDSRIFDKMVLNKRVLNICDYYLFKHYLLSVTQLIKLFPNEAKQAWHHDGSSYIYTNLPRYKNVPLKVSAIWAITDFTENNGSTVVIPKSHLWGNKKRYSIKEDCSEFIKVVMPKGSVCIFLDALVHSAGSNTSNTARMAATVQYSQPWIRTQENYMLSVPLDIVETLPKKMQNMIGYSMHNMYGNVKGRHPRKYIDILLKRYSKL